MHCKDLLLEMSMFNLYEGPVVVLTDSEILMNSYP